MPSLELSEKDVALLVACVHRAKFAHGVSEEHLTNANVSAIYQRLRGFGAQAFPKSRIFNDGYRQHVHDLAGSEKWEEIRTALRICFEEGGLEAFKTAIYPYYWDRSDEELNKFLGD